ncbi:hypothetical protein [Leptospira noguchii]|nr:hypothetical protein [Leptospira noguchii]UOG30731.1 hypothetical protein MAL06_01100 [Leptospira noguchii]
METQHNAFLWVALKNSTQRFPKGRVGNSAQRFPMGRVEKLSTTLS